MGKCPVLSFRGREKCNGSRIVFKTHILNAYKLIHGQKWKNISQGDAQGKSGEAVRCKSHIVMNEQNYLGCRTFLLRMTTERKLYEQPCLHSYMGLNNDKKCCENTNL